MTHPTDYTFATLQDHIGHDFGVSKDISITQDRINQFADATGDHQWIHIDVERAKQHSPFGGTIAHGFLTLSLIGGIMGECGVVPTDAKAVFNYGCENVRFLAPVPAGAIVRARFSLKAVEPRGDGRKLIRVAGTVEIEGSDKPALVGEFLALAVG